MTKRSKGGRTVKFEPPRDERDARRMGAARRCLRAEMSREEAPVSHWACTENEKHAEYIDSQRESTKYPHSVEANAALGSGVVKTACTALVTERLEVSGEGSAGPGGSETGPWSASTRDQGREDSSSNRP